MSRPSRVYTATYSNIPVIECIIRGIQVMMRRKDHALNATQILKVAGMDKSRRTKILEREVHPGQHEKVQGGYGKYQGTWVCFERGAQLAAKYNVTELMRPLLEWKEVELDPANMGEAASPAVKAKEAKVIKREEEITEQIDSGEKKKKKEAQNEKRPGPKRTKAPLTDSAVHDGQDSKRQKVDADGELYAPGRRRRTISQLSASSIPGKKHTDRNRNRKLSTRTEEGYREQLVGLFMSNVEADKSEGLYADLLNGVPPPGLNANVPIDAEKNTSAHWAASLGRIQELRWLLETCNADPARGNAEGETPLMHAIAATNSFEKNVYPQILDLLGSTILVTDNQDCTVLHRIALTAKKGRPDVARYYMVNTLKWCEEHGLLNRELLEQRDANGDTALSVAADVGCQPIISDLIAAGADVNTQTVPLDFSLDSLGENDFDMRQAANTLFRMLGHNSYENPGDMSETKSMEYLALTQQYLRESKDERSADVTRGVEILTTLRQTVKDSLEDKNRLEQELKEKLLIKDELTQAVAGQRRLSYLIEELNNLSIDPVDLNGCDVSLLVQAYEQEAQEMEEELNNLRSRSLEPVEKQHRALISQLTGREEWEIDRHLDDLYQVIQVRHGERFQRDLKQKYGEHPTADETLLYMENLLQLFLQTY